MASPDSHHSHRLERLMIIAISLSTINTLAMIMLAVSISFTLKRINNQVDRVESALETATHSTQFMRALINRFRPGCRQSRLKLSNLVDAALLMRLLGNCCKTDTDSKSI